MFLFDFGEDISGVIEKSYRLNQNVVGFFVFLFGWVFVCGVFIFLFCFTGFFFVVVPVWMIPRKMFQCPMLSHGNTTFEGTILLVEDEWALGLSQHDSDQYIKGFADLRISPVFRGQNSCGILWEKKIY